MTQNTDSRGHAVWKGSVGRDLRLSDVMRPGSMVGRPWRPAAFLLAILLIAIWPIWAGEAPLEGAGAPGNEGKGGFSLLELLAKGGPVVVVIGLFSIVAMAVAVERFVSLRRSRIIPPNFMRRLGEAFGSEGNDVAAALAYCERAQSPLANVIRAGVQKLGRRLEIVEKAVEDAAARETDRMRRGLETLAMVGSISPLLGLLGTIYGMISAFQTAAEQGLGRAEVLATGIYEALVTTAAGLTVAVPTLLLYHFFVGKVERLTEEVERVGNEFLDQCYEEPGGPASRVTEERAAAQPKESSPWAEAAPDAG